MTRRKRGTASSAGAARPTGGGSYVRDRKTGKLQVVEQTAQPQPENPAFPQAAAVTAEEPAIDAGAREEEA